MRWGEATRIEFRPVAPNRNSEVTFVGIASRRPPKDPLDVSSRRLQAWAALIGAIALLISAIASLLIALPH
jgi:hypothetical protein